MIIIAEIHISNQINSMQNKSDQSKAKQIKSNQFIELFYFMRMA
jgi:hypothetical protein